MILYFRGYSLGYSYRLPPDHDSGRDKKNERAKVRMNETADRVVGEM